MAARAQAQAASVYVHRARSVWTVLVLSTMLFCVVCAASGIGIYGFLNNVTSAEQASLQLVHGTQLVVIRHLSLNREAVERTATLNEGDEVRTGPNTEANIDLFDGSTIHLYFDTHIRLSSLRTGRFFGSRKDIGLHVASGTAVVSTSDKGEYEWVGYTADTPHAEIHIAGNSISQVQVGGEGASSDTQVVVTLGSVEVLAGGKRVELRPGNMTTVSSNGAPSDTRPAERDLIRNGDFKDPPTSGAELEENGGLGTAAWIPFRTLAGEISAGTGSIDGTVEVASEDLPEQSITSVKIDRPDGDARFAKLGIRQEINAPASFLSSIELRTTVKVVDQTEPVGGPRGDVFPLTIKVSYTDPNGRPQEWRHSFYLRGTDAPTPGSAEAVPLGSWHTSDRLVLKGFTGEPAPRKASKPSIEPEPTPSLVGQDIAVIHSIEIYGIGTEFQSWISDIALVVR